MLFCITFHEITSSSLGNKVEAEKYYEEALLLFPEFPEAHQNLAHLHDGNMNYDKAGYHHQLSIEYAANNKFKAAAMMNLFSLKLKLITVPKRDELNGLLLLLGCY